MFAAGSVVYSEEYMEQILELFQDPAVLGIMTVYAVVLIAISLIVCYFIARSSKISKKYVFFGFLGVTGILIVVCRAMAKSVDLSPHFMWLGLLGIYGIIIMAVIMAVTSYRKMGTAGQNPYEKEREGRSQGNAGRQGHPYQTEWERKYEEGRREREEEQKQGYNLNGTYYEHDSGTICLNCGAAVAAGEKICPRCKNQVR